MAMFNQMIYIYNYIYICSFFWVISNPGNHAIFWHVPAWKRHLAGDQTWFSAWGSMSIYPDIRFQCLSWLEGIQHSLVDCIFFAGVCQYGRLEFPMHQITKVIRLFHPTVGRQAIDDFHIGPFSVYKQTFGAPFGCGELRSLHLQFRSVLVTDLLTVSCNSAWSFYNLQYVFILSYLIYLYLYSILYIYYTYSV